MSSFSAANYDISATIFPICLPGSSNLLNNSDTNIFQLYSQVSFVFL